MLKSHCVDTTVVQCGCSSPQSSVFGLPPVFFALIKSDASTRVQTDCAAAHKNEDKCFSEWNDYQA
jgi:hypothetical protein